METGLDQVGAEADQLGIPGHVRARKSASCRRGAQGEPSVCACNGRSGFHGSAAGNRRYCAMLMKAA